MKVTSLVIACVVLYQAVTCLSALNIALHAQLFPANDKVVGSVITTNGLKSAFLGRPDVLFVDIFYPAHYSTFLNHTWDVVLIEGWFPSIDQFLGLTRNNFPQAKIVFISLDPIYPGVDIVRNFDVDGILTNSEELVLYYGDIFPSESMLLAADPAVMRPFANITRDYGAVYIGAGGNMLEYKPELYSLLVSAVQYGLRLHGNAWENVPVLRDVWQGGLPLHELARAYASAHVVLGSTIDAQSQYHMINNRIFEALACGALVVTKHAEELAALKCEALLLTDDTRTLHTYMQQLALWSAEEVERRRQAGRDCVLSKHTWGHRAVQIIDFYHSLPDEQALRRPSTGAASDAYVCGDVHCMRANCPRLLWLVSPHIRLHQDYLYVARTMGKLQLCGVFSITVLPSEAVLLVGVQALQGFDCVISFVTPFDALDVAMRSLPAVSKPAAYGLAPVLQKRAAYLIGYDTALVDAYLEASLSKQSDASALSFRHYDSVWSRSPFEMELLTALNGAEIASPGRMQHVFGLGVVREAVVQSSEVAAMGSYSDTAPEVHFAPSALVVVCIYPHVDLCCQTNREHYVRMYGSALDASSVQARYTLLLLGGTWTDWLGVDTGADALPFLSQQDLLSVIHVGKGRTGDALNIVQNAAVVAVLNPTFGNTQSFAALRQCQIATDSSSYDARARGLLDCQRNFPVSTTSEALWPLVAAAVSSARIHLLNSSPQLMDVVRQDCSGWSQEAFVVMVRTGMNRLLGLGSIHTAVSAKLLPTQFLVAADSPVLQCGPDCTRADVSFVESYFVNNNVSFDDLNQWSSTRLLFLSLSYEEFHVGRDGECCLQQSQATSVNFTTSEKFAEDEQIPGDKICLMRPYKYVVVQLRAPAEKHLCGKSIPLLLSVQLRGSFFGDPFLSLDMRLDDVAQRSVPAPKAWNGEWLAAHNAYVYTASYC